MRHSAALKQLWKSFWWPEMQWCMEVVIHLAQTGFKHVTPLLRRKLELFVGALRVSLPCENGGNRLQIRSRAHNAKRMCKIEKFHCLLNSPILEAFERSPATPTPEDDLARPKALNDNFIFSTTGWKHTVGKDFDLLGAPADHLTTTHEGRMQCFLNFASFIDLGGDFKATLELWKCNLPVVGHLLARAPAVGLSSTIIYAVSVLFDDRC